VDLSLEDALTVNRLATVSRLLSGAVHEVNNALQVIGGTVELSSADPGLSDPVRKALERIAVQAARASGAMVGMIEMARARPAAAERVDLRRVVEDACGLRRYAIGRAGLTLRVEVGARPLPVRALGAQLLQALVNLVENAEHALGPRGDGRIHIRAAVEDSWARVDVEDDGPGVSAEVAERLFQPFVTTRPQRDSLGLGLFVARAVAQAHGGSLVRDPRTAGAAFLMRLPLDAA
jgi:signal transduction histidine kinase